MPAPSSASSASPSRSPPAAAPPPEPISADSPADRQRSAERLAPGLATRAVHAGRRPDPTTGALLAPIHQSTTYAQPDLGADLAHTYLYLMGYNAPEAALLKEGYSDDEFWAAYKTMTDALRPWTIDFHVAQNDGSVHGTGSHDKTGRHCPADDPNGKLDIAKCSTYWLEGAAERGIEHICWDGCMFDNSVLEDPATWNAILKAMIDVDKAL